MSDRSEAPYPLAGRSVARAALLALSIPETRAASLRCFSKAFRNFFLLQFRAALSPGKIPIRSVDHPLDGDIPFEPGRVAVYLDFVPFWIRAVGFILEHFGRDARNEAADFIDSMGELYTYAAQVYARNLSTTRRPRYLARPRFLLIHAADPHLLCVPSLHVMVVVRAYTHFRHILGRLEERTGKKVPSKEGLEHELRNGALEITETILFVKQHSVNCIPAALYAMTCFDRNLFSPEEAQSFLSDLFVRPSTISGTTASAIREHIQGLYRRFLAQGEAAADWKEPILAFLSEQPYVSKPGRNS
jgi:hypothetical protein